MVYLPIMINKIFKNRYFLFVVQFFTLSVFIALIYGAIGITTKDPDFAKILRNTNIANLIVWSYWWPLIIVTAILFGRYWCSVCPMEMITSFFGNIGLRRKPNKLLKSGWVITLFYAVILIIGIHTLAIHRIPQYMAIYMILLFGIAVISGLIWEKRTFCTYICPIGHLLGLYSMLSFKKLRVINPSVCESCESKDCISKENHYKFTGRSCTSELYPAKMKDNRSCLLCGQCFKSCTKDNIAIQTRSFAADIFKNIKLTWAELSFFMMVSGFVIYEVLSEWKVSKAIIMKTPNWINHSLNITGSLHGTIKAITLFIIIPAVFFMTLALLKKLLAKETILNSFTQLVMAMLPITASMHLLKALLKTTSRIPYWDFVFTDPKGVNTAQALIEKSKTLDKGILLSLSPYLSALAVLFSLGGIILSLMVIHRQKFNNKTSKAISLFAALLYSGIFLIGIIAWRFF